VGEKKKKRQSNIHHPKGEEEKERGGGEGVHSWGHHGKRETSANGTADYAINGGGERTLSGGRQTKKRRIVGKEKGWGGGKEGEGCVTHEKNTNTGRCWGPLFQNKTGELVHYL